MIITLRECDAVELITTLEFLADWLAADCQVAAERLGLHGTYNIARLEADIRRIALQLKEPFE